MKIEDLGLSKETLTTLIVDSAVEQIFSGSSLDLSNEDIRVSAEIITGIEARTKAHIDNKIDAVAAEHLLPKINEKVENIVLQQTNDWGEAKGGPVSFVEYLVQRADAYMREPVNHNGKTKSEDSYNWRKNTSRISYMVDKHLQYSISVAMEKALKDANSSITEGLKEAVSIALDQVRDKLKITVKV